jgi:hypothetical protein
LRLMWCVNCQSDVVAEVGSGNRRVHCSICGTTIGETAVSQMEDQPIPSANHSRTTEAKNLLDRWANSHIFDPYGPPKNGIASSTPAAATPAAANEVAPTSPDASTSSSLANDRPDLSQPVETQSVSSNAEVQQSNLAVPSEPSSIPLPGLAVPSPPSPAPSIAPAAPNSLSATSDELDRLTNDILSRVARITEDAQQPQVDLTHEAETAAQFDSNLAENSALLGALPEQPSPGPFPAHQVNARPKRPSAKSDPRPILDDVASKKWRIDAQDDQTTPPQSPVPKPHSPTPRTVAAESPVAIEHREIKSAVTKFQDERQSDSAEKKGNWFGGVGQALAYMGILGLTAGTSLVILGYFGGPTEYAPTGWLITTVGQMLLFLGVVTLVSAGMEQTTVEVKQTVDESLKELTAKLNDLGDRIIRIEHQGHEPGPPEPHFNSRVRTRDTERVSR